MKGFDSKLYLKLQSENIIKKINGFDKLYLEFGGKLFDDFHASRVLPGFEPNIKVQLLEKLKDKTEIIFCISANDIEKNKIRADFGITYDAEVMRLIDNLRAEGLLVNSVVITLFTGQPLALKFAEKLKRHNEKVYFHSPTKGYPTDVKTIVSEEGYGANPYIPTTKPLVIVTAPGANSGKLGTCLSQMYHEYKQGRLAGYAKFETFPVWNLPLKHMVNVAYEAATADLKDVNMIDPFYYQMTGEIAINYNRDIEVFPVLKEILTRITKKPDYYTSPTDMGVNMIAFAITDDAVVSEASRQEIIRRYYKANADFKKGNASYDTVERIMLLMNEAQIDKSERKVVEVAKNKKIETDTPVVAIELKNGTMITGRSKDILSASAAAVLNAIKYLAEIPDKIKLISPEVLKPILSLQNEILHRKKTKLSVRDVLTALSISALQNEIAKAALEQVKNLAGCEAHATHILNPSDEDTFRRLQVNMTTEAKFLSNSLFDV